MKKFITRRRIAHYIYYLIAGYLLMIVSQSIIVDSWTDSYYDEVFFMDRTTRHTKNLWDSLTEYREDFVIGFYLIGYWLVQILNDWKMRG